MKKIFVPLFVLIFFVSYSFSSGIVDQPTITVKAEIIGPVDDNGNVEVLLQDQMTRAVELKFIRALNNPGATSLDAPITASDTTWQITPTTGAAVGGIVVVVNADGTYNIAGIVAFDAGSITVDTPADTAMITTATNVIIGTAEMTSAVGTLANPIIYQIAGAGAATGVEIDITRIMGIIQDDDSMDDSLFGGGPALVNGVVLRLNNGGMTNIWNIKTNGDIALICFDANYHSTGPAISEFSLRFRNTFAGTDKHGVVLRLAPGDTLEILIQDTLVVDSFRMMGQGHFTN
jgi:hypothetical protein